MSTSVNEIIVLLIFIGGFVLTFVFLAQIIESKWPSKDRVRFGNFGLVRKHTVIFVFIWLAIYLYLFSLIYTKIF